MQPLLAKLALNTEWFKYTLVIVTSPIWWPFVRELWKEFNDILAEEGGLLGRKPTEEELAGIRRRRAVQEAALVRELREEERQGRGRSRSSGPRQAFGASELRRPGGAGGRGGFGPPR
jgi:hypothetical protein